MLISKKIVLDTSCQKDLAVILQKENFDFHENEHAFWRAKGNNASIIFYKNGSVLFQGNENTINTILHNLNITSLFKKADDSLKYPVLGLDESGKGDYFGPLVLAGAVINKEQKDPIIKDGVMDSKKITDFIIRQLFTRLKNKIIYSVRVIEPQEYNKLYEKHGNLNKLMMAEYINLVNYMKKQPFNTVILDKFTSSEDLNDNFRNNLSQDSIIVEKGESFTAVAAASIMARYHFLDWIEKKSNELGIEIPKGCGKDASRLFLKMKKDLSSADFLKYAKAHFKAAG